jgi:competence protein ComEA
LLAVRQNQRFAAALALRQFSVRGLLHTSLEHHTMFKKLLAAVLAFVAAAAFAAVDVNKATQAELEGIKGVGPAIAGKILDERKKSNFKDWGDLVTRVNGIGEGNAAKFSEGGLTVAGSSFKGVTPAAAPAKKEEKAAAPAAKKEDKAMATPAAAKKDDKPAAAAAPAKAEDKPAAKAADAKPAAKEDPKAAKEAAAKAKAEEKAKAKAEKEAAAKAKADEKAKAKKEDKPAAKADKEAKPAAAAASGAKK